MKRRNRPNPKILISPHPSLTTVCDDVFPGEDIERILLEMRYIIFHNKKCVGISANQLGYDKKIIVVQNGESSVLVMINPAITGVSDKMMSMKEGCLSYPGVRKSIKRPIAIQVDYETEDRNKITGAKFSDFVARIICHEYDHLNGKCLVGM